MASQTPSENAAHLDEALRRQVEQWAHAQGVSSADVIRKAIEEYLSRHTNGGQKPPHRRRSLSAAADAIAASVAPDEWEKVPTDLAKNFEHYRYGYPRED